MLSFLLTINLKNRFLIDEDRKTQDKKTIMMESTQNDIIQGSENNHIDFSGEKNITLPLILMISSLVSIIIFYIYHMYRITKDINSVSPFFDIAETETKIEFTIAERNEIQSDGIHSLPTLPGHDELTDQKKRESSTE